MFDSGSRGLHNTTYWHSQRQQDTAVPHWLWKAAPLTLYTEYNNNNDRLTAFDPGQPG